MKRIPAAALAALSVAFSGASADAQSVRAPECAARLARADELVAAVSDRTYKAPPPATTAALCRLLRANLVEMREARGHMAACMSGHARRENVGQMDVSMSDIEEVIARRCR